FEVVVSFMQNFALFTRQQFAKTLGVVADKVCDLLECALTGCSTCRPVIASFFGCCNCSADVCFGVLGSLPDNLECRRVVYRIGRRSHEVPPVTDQLLSSLSVYVRKYE